MRTKDTEGPTVSEVQQGLQKCSENTYGEESSADGGLLVFLEVVLHESKDDGGLADSRFTYDRQLWVRKWTQGDICECM